MEHPSEPAALSRPRPGWVLPTAVSGLLVVASLTAWGMLRTPAPLEQPALRPAPALPVAETPPDSIPAAPPVAPPDDKDYSIDKLLGTWVCRDSIRRCIQVRDDGTASMNVKLDFIASLIYGSELNLELTWKLDGDSLVYFAVSGEPKANVDRLLKDFGRQQTYDIVEFEEGRMLLEDRSDKSRYDWRREAL